MTVAELIEKLKLVDQRLDVIARFDNGEIERQCWPSFVYAAKAMSSGQGYQVIRLGDPRANTSLMDVIVIE